MGILTGGLIGNWISNAWNGILLTIDYVIYMIINVCYQLFEVVSKVEVFSTDKVSLIANRIYTILGIVMLFVFAYNIILGIIDPDSISKGDKSMKSIAQNTVISIVLVTLFPLICEYLQTFQNHIIENGTIGNLILGSTVSETSGDIGKKTAYQIPVTIFTAFYHPINDNKEPVTLMECENGADVDICDRYSELARDAKNGTGKLWVFMHDSDLLDGIYDEEMEYLFPLSTIAGALAAYLFLSFSIDLGVRAAKLGALKLIAPIPIFLRITKPKGGQFDKWFSDFTKTYLQVFERIMIIYFAVLIISFVPDIDWTAGGGSWFINVIASVVIILGILKFAKDAPKMLEELFSIKIPEMSIKKKIGENEYAMRGASMLGGAAMTGAGNFLKARKDGKTGGEVLKTTLGGIVGGGRQGWIKGKGVNEIGKLKDSIMGARATADEHRDDRAAHSRALSNAWLKDHGAEYTARLRNEHPDWTDEQIKNKVEEYARYHGTLYDRTRDNIAGGVDSFKDYLQDGSNPVLQRSVDNQTKLKGTVSSFLKNVANKGSYDKIKKGRDDFITDSYQGKLTTDEFISRISNIKPGAVTKDERSGKYQIGDKLYDFNSANDRESAIKAIYGDMLSSEQGKSLEKLGQEGCAEYAQSLSKQFDQIAFSIDNDDVRDKLEGMVNDLVAKSKEQNMDYEAFAKQYEELETALTRSINKSQASLASEQAKKDGK